MDDLVEKNPNIPSRSSDIKPLPKRGGGRSGRSDRVLFPTPTRDEIKKQESVLLDAWTQDQAFLVGAVLVVCLAVYFILVVGPPPSTAPVPVSRDLLM